MKSFQVVVLYLCIISVSSGQWWFLISYLCIVAHGSCIGGDRGLTSTTVWLTYYCGENMVEEAELIIALYKNTTVNLTYALERDNVYDWWMWKRGVSIWAAWTMEEESANCVYIYFDEYCETNNRVSLWNMGADLANTKLTNKPTAFLIKYAIKFWPPNITKCWRILDKWIF